MLTAMTTFSSASEVLLKQFGELMLLHGVEATAKLSHFPLGFGPN